MSQHEPATLKVAIAQLSPVLMNRAATVERAAEAVREAGRNDAKLVAFGETFIPAYPVWLARSDAARFEAADVKAVHSSYLDQAFDLEADHLDPLRDAARQASTKEVVGVAERPRDRGSHSVYCTAVVIAEDGTIASAHRKLMPTYEERLSWAMGDGHGLVTHACGPFTLGARNCWENWMPLARARLYAQGENLHVALWPGCLRLTGEITRFIAKESRSYVISASAIIRASDVPMDLPQRQQWVGDESETFYDGGSCIAGPDGEWVVEPVVNEEGLIYAELDLRRVLEERQNFDPSGHCARPEVLGLSVDRRRMALARFTDD